MAEKQNYNCKKCGKDVEAAAGETAPECCDETMVETKLPYCETSSTAEHSRADDMGEPCDDGRQG